MMHTCLMIVVKEPIPGQVKTRLAAGIGDAHALALYEAFIADTVATAQSVPEVDVALVFWPPAAEPYFATRYPALTRWPQQGPDLGARLLAALEEAHRRGYERLIVIGSDSPSLPQPYLQAAIRSLDNADVVIGPSDDGGYYLIGMRQPHPILFRNITWSTEVVYRETMDQAAQTQLAMTSLPRWYDIDTAADLPRLRDDLRTAVPAAATLAILNTLHLPDCPEESIHGEHRSDHSRLK